MSLVTRLCIFFLAALAITLAGFSGLLFFLARAYLFDQLGERLNSGLNAVVAAAEIEPDGVEWDRTQHRLLIDQRLVDGLFCWTVHDGAGKLIDCSANASSVHFPLSLPPDALGTATTFRGDVGPWRLARERLQAPQPEINDGPDENEYLVLLITAGVSNAPVHATLRQLEWTLFIISVVIWVFAAGLARWLSRTTLRPVIDMLRSVRSIDAQHLTTRLPASTGEIGELAHAFNDLLTRLQESFERQRRFTGDASHQLRTPLTAVLGQIEIACRRQRPAADYRRSLEVIAEEARRMQRIIEALLFMARADSDAMAIDLEPVELHCWLKCHLATWQTRPRGPDIAFHCRTATPALVSAHRTLLGQLVDNLLDNACKYSPTNLPIIVALEAAANCTVISVTDRGPGLNNMERQYIFEPFHRTSFARRANPAGVGLGLALVKRIAQVFGGVAEVSSPPEGGLCFAIRFPERTARSSKLPDS